MRGLIFVLLLVALPAQAQNKFGQGDLPPGADPALAKPLPERKDVVSWRVLAQVELVRMKDRYVPKFAPEVRALDKREVKVQGYMMPLQTGDKQTHFVLAAMPQTCAFCMPGGPESFVEVKTKKAVKYGFEPVIVTGRLEVLSDDPTGVFYRMSDAAQTH